MLMEHSTNSYMRMVEHEYSIPLAHEQKGDHAPKGWR
jgi:hypothetical protein